MKLPPRVAVTLTATALLAGGAVASAAPAAATTQAASATQAAWKSMALPSSVQQPASLYDVSAANKSLAWAVGAQGELNYNTDKYTSTPLMLSWNGKTWSQVKLPHLAPPASLTSVSAISASDAWAVGSYDAVTGSFGDDEAKAVVLHWNGKTWASVSFPGSATAAVNAIAVAPNGTAWLAGKTSANIGSLLVEEWNGKAWKVVSTGLGATSASNPGSWASNVRVSADGDVWVTGGEYGGGLDGDYDLPLLGYEHDGTWKSLNPPNLDTVNNPSPTSLTDADDVLAVSPTGLWVAGQGITMSDGVGEWVGTVVYHYNGKTWQLDADPMLNSKDAEDSSDAFLSPGSSGQPQWLTGAVNLGGGDTPAPTATSYQYLSGGSSWSIEKGATALGQSSSYGKVDAFQAAVAHIPGTNATFAVGGTYAGGSYAAGEGDGAAYREFIEYNPGS
jgi:hypothetical protein